MIKNCLEFLLFMKGPKNLKLLTADWLQYDQLLVLEIVNHLFVSKLQLIISESHIMPESILQKAKSFLLVITALI